MQSKGFVLTDSLTTYALSLVNSINQLKHYIKQMRIHKLSYHSAVATINVYLVPQYNKRKIFRVVGTGLNISRTENEVRLKT